MKNELASPPNHKNAPYSPLQPGNYEIRIKGFVDPGWDWLTGFSVTYIESGETLVSGRIVDQAALHGLFARIRDLNLVLLAVNQIDPEDQGKKE